MSGLRPPANKPDRERWWLPGAVAAGVIASLTLLPLAAIVFKAGGTPLHELAGDTYLWRVVRFSFWQAFLSTLLSLLLAMPLALALSQLPQFVGRSLLLNAMSLTLVLPTLIAIYGIVAVFGQRGWIDSLLGLGGLDMPAIYGLNGILLAHVFLNMPLAARVMLQAIESIDSTQWRLASQLGMRERTVLRLLEWPAIAPTLMPFAVLVFTLCFTSFAIVMTLGGGPRATTIEVAIYQAVRFDFDLARAVTLALLQMFICVALMLLGLHFRHEQSVTWGDSALALTGDSRRQSTHFQALHPSLRSNRLLLAARGALVALAALFIFLPLLALLFAALNNKTLEVLTDNSTRQALGNTLMAALAASCLATALALMLLSSSRYLVLRRSLPRTGRGLQLVGNMILVLPPLVLGTGLFLLLRPVADVFSLALILVVLVNALMGLPFVLRILEGPWMDSAREHDRVLQSLGISGWHRWRWIDWPQLRQPLGRAMAVAATLAAGDLSAIALFGSSQWQTLPLLLYQRMGSYRLDEAAATAGLLLIVSVALYLGLQRLVGGRRAAS